MILSILYILPFLVVAENEPPKSCDNPAIVKNENSCELPKPQVIDDHVIGCLSLENNPREIYDDDAWKFLQDTYEKLFRSQGDIHEYGYWHEFEEFHLRDDYYSEEDTEDDVIISITAPHEVRYLPGGGGRGIFVTEDVDMHDLTYIPDAYGVFHTENAWKTFLLEVASVDVGLACDILQWSYVQRVDEGEDDVAVCLDLSVGSLMNHGGADTNIYQGGYEQYASRDIKAGEELLDNYSDYFLFGKLIWYEDMVANAWRDECNTTGEMTSDEMENQWNYRITRKK